jgi:hypothetical protein
MIAPNMMMRISAGVVEGERETGATPTGCRQWCVSCLFDPVRETRSIALREAC